MDKFIATLFLLALTCVVYFGFKSDVEPAFSNKTADVVSTIDSTQTK